MEQATAIEIRLPPSPEPREIAASLPEALGAKPGHSVELVVFGEHRVQIDAIAVVPLADELSPPAPEPWRGAAGTKAAPGPG
jgi:hypothetical protein